MQVSCWIATRKHWSRHAKWWIMSLSRAWLDWHHWCMRCDNDSKMSNMRKLISDLWLDCRILRIRHDMLITWNDLFATLYKLLLLMMRKMRIMRKMKKMRKMMKKKIYFIMFKNFFSDMIIKNNLSWKCNNFWIQMRKMMMRCRFWECSVCLIYSFFK